MGVRSPLEPRMRAQRDVLAVEWNGSVNAVRYKHVQTSFWVLEDEMLPRRISQAPRAGCADRAPTSAVERRGTKLGDFRKYERLLLKSTLECRPTQSICNMSANLYDFSIF